MADMLGYNTNEESMNEEPQGFQPEQDRDQETLELIDLFNYADEYRSQFEEDNLEYYRIYMQKRDAPTNEDGDGEESTGSNLHIPLSYEQIDTLRARLMDSIISTRPYIDMSARMNRNMDQQAMIQAEEKAQLAAANVDYQLELNKYPLIAYQWITDLLVFQAAILSVGWRKETKMVKRRQQKQIVVEQTQIDPTTQMPVVVPVQQMTDEYEVVTQEETIWDDNEIQNVDFFDFWFDPRAKGTDPDQNRFVFHRTWMTWDELIEYLDLLSQGDSGVVYDIDKDFLKTSGAEVEDGVWKKLQRIGIAPEERDGTNADQEDDHLMLYEVLHYWEDTKHKVLVNRAQLAYTGENPYWRHGKKPFSATCFDPISGQPYGKCGMQVLHHLQDELDTTENQFIDNIGLFINNMYEVVKGADIDESEFRSRPNGIIHVDMIGQTMAPIQKDVNGAMVAMQHNATIGTRMENALPTPPVSRGIGAEKTATVSMINNDNSNTRYRAKVKLYACTAIQRLAYLMDCNNQQFMEEPRLIKLYGQEGVAAWRQIDVGDIMGEHDYTPAIAVVDSVVNKAIQNQQLTQVYPLAIQDPDVDQYEFKKMYYESFDGIGQKAAKFLKSKDEVQARQMQQMAAQQQQMDIQNQQAQQQGEQHQMGMINQGIDVVKKMGDMINPPQPGEGGAA